MALVRIPATRDAVIEDYRDRFADYASVLEPYFGRGDGAGRRASQRWQRPAGPLDETRSQVEPQPRHSIYGGVPREIAEKVE